MIGVINKEILVLIGFKSGSCTNERLLVDETIKVSKKKKRTKSLFLWSNGEVQIEELGVRNRVQKTVITESFTQGVIERISGVNFQD